MRLIKFKPNKQTRTCYAPLLNFMLNRAPKLTARKFYAPLLRLTRSRATNRKQCAETEAKRNWTFASFQRTDERQSAVSLIHSL